VYESESIDVKENVLKMEEVDDDLVKVEPCTEQVGREAEDDDALRLNEINSFESIVDTAKGIPANSKSKVRKRKLDDKCNDTVSIRGKRQKKKREIFNCIQCDYKSDRIDNVRRHNESKHVKYHCNLCEFTTAGKHRFKRHRVKQHDLKYPCDQCHFSADNAAHLREHMKSQHDGGKKFQCDKCTYATDHSAHFKDHKQSQHDRLRLQCDQCEYSTISIKYLHQHKKAVHDGVRYPCDLCRYIGTTAPQLYVHKKTKH